jgi:hypothetical protein
VLQAKTKSRIRIVAVIIGIVVLLAGLFVVLMAASFKWADWRAERQAKAFCNAIPIGSDVAPAVARAGQYSASKHPWGYSFVFQANFDSAYCDVRTDAGGKVLEKRTQMLYD